MHGGGRAAVLACGESQLGPRPVASEEDMGFAEGTPVLHGSGDFSQLGRCGKTQSKPQTLLQSADSEQTQYRERNGQRHCGKPGCHCWDWSAADDARPL